ncbi:MAG: UDP-N-acetylmuramate dehydrogenase [Anaerolineae bacterium]|nr:UDP-N-acetylmuramate dehydrogenase [Anaerolineae bacterium]
MTFPSDFLPYLRPNEPLARYSALRLGGPAEWLYIENDSSARLVEIVSAAWAENIATRILGSGANVLISDRGVRGLVVINRIMQVDFGETSVTASGGHGLTALARKCAKRGLSGLEWAASVPGTVGGAAVNNAGAHNGNIAGILTALQVYDFEQGEITLQNQDLSYAYRASSLKKRPDRRFIVLNVTLSLRPANPETINATMDEFVAYRKHSQPTGASLGSIFKNPPGDYAGRLIESCGLKGYTVGGAQISSRHANFFINSAGATAADYRALIEHVRDVVTRETGVILEPEVEFVGDW